MSDCIVEKITGENLYRKMRLSYSIGDCKDTITLAAQYDLKYCSKCDSYRSYKKCLFLFQPLNEGYKIKK